MDEAYTIGVIGGSGLYDIAGLEDTERRSVETPWGAPSADILLGTMHGKRMAFLPRHGRGHSIPPNEINYRANIDAMKRCGVREIVSISACGSFQEQMEPGHFVVVDQFIDRTKSRNNTFFGTGCVGHVSLAQPVCARLADAAAAAAEAAGATVHRGGAYLAMEGPQFSTYAESILYRTKFDCAVIGMTNMPEARLAREAEICYSTLAMVTDYDCWHAEHGEVDVPKILQIMQQNNATALATIDQLAQLLPAEREPCPHGCEHALEYAIITQPDYRDPAILAKLDAVAGRVLR